MSYTFMHMEGVQLQRKFDSVKRQRILDIAHLLVLRAAAAAAAAVLPTQPLADLQSESES